MPVQDPSRIRFPRRLPSSPNRGRAQALGEEEETCRNEATETSTQTATPPSISSFLERRKTVTAAIALTERSTRNVRSNALLSPLPTMSRKISRGNFISPCYRDCDGPPRLKAVCISLAASWPRVNVCMGRGFGSAKELSIRGRAA